MLDHNDEGSGRFAQWTAYLVRVDESFRGLDPLQKEVFIDPGSFSSCYTEYQVGRQYLFVASGPASFAAMTLINKRMPEKSFPARWSTKGDLKVYSTGACSPTRDTSRASEDIVWLRNLKRGVPKTRVFGLVVQNHDAFHRPPDQDEDIPLPGARVTLKGAGESFTTVSGADGRYSFEGIRAGTYRLEAEKRMWTSSRAMAVDVNPGGCARRDLSLDSAGEVQGRVLDSRGNPVEDVRVELVRILPTGNIARSYTR
ncbi:MAG TPA: carboxypeptidase regulatory-like domain-containing protein [Bryobacteraceae bacterium]|nr:carboxypeptidase regulatory-like domain-containing protein [Bryobacteraceae bacterium]